VDEVRNLNFLEFFKFFEPQKIKKQLNLYSNDQIHIQMIEFKFKWTNQKTPPHYRPPTPAAGGTARAIAPNSAPMLTLPPTSGTR
jgi:hypothetical protein